LVNIFLHSSGLDWVISVLGVLIFTGLTAYGADRNLLQSQEAHHRITQLCVGYLNPPAGIYHEGLGA
jgi:FtsH-binding integral membrane protein